LAAIVALLGLHVGMEEAKLLLQATHLDLEVVGSGLLSRQLFLVLSLGCPQLTVVRNLCVLKLQPLVLQRLFRSLQARLCVLYLPLQLGSSLDGGST